MPLPSDQLIRQQLRDAAAAESDLASRLQELSSQGDDDEVRAAFHLYSEQSNVHHELVGGRLLELNSDDLTNSEWAGFLGAVPKVSHAGRILEEQTAQNLMTAYTLEAGASAVYESLAVTSHAAGDSATEQLARQILSAKQSASEKLWHFLPSRSKIAFNMLTVQEVDPSVETKVADDRLIET